MKELVEVCCELLAVMCAAVGACVERVLLPRSANYYRAFTIEEDMKLGRRRGLVACEVSCAKWNDCGLILGLAI